MIERRNYRLKLRINLETLAGALPTLIKLVGDELIEIDRRSIN